MIIKSNPICILPYAMQVPSYPIHVSNFLNNLMKDKMSKIEYPDECTLKRNIAQYDIIIFFYLFIYLVRCFQKICEEG